MLGQITSTSFVSRRATCARYVQHDENGPVWVEGPPLHFTAPLPHTVWTKLSLKRETFESLNGPKHSS